MNKQNLLSGAPLYYPSAKEWMWNYCIYLGPFTDNDGHNWDLGIYIRDDKEPGSTLYASNASVYGNSPGNYMSGPLSLVTDDIALEVVRRARLLNLMPEEKQPVKKQKPSGIERSFIEDHVDEINDEYYMDQDDYPGL